MVDRRTFVHTDSGLGMSIPTFLFAVAGPPTLWITHLSVCYFLLTLGCITDWDGAGWAMALATALFAAATVAAGWIARRGWRRLGPDRVRPDEREWGRFLLVLGMGGSVLFTLTIVLEGLAPYFVSFCS